MFTVNLVIWDDKNGTKQDMPDILEECTLGEFDTAEEAQRLVSLLNALSAGQTDESR